MSRYRRVPHFVLATWRKRAAASINADLPSGNAPTARVLRRTSRSNRSKGLKLADAAALVLAGIDETLYYYAFPSEHFISFNFTATCSAFCRAAARSSCA